MQHIRRGGRGSSRKSTGGEAGTPYGTRQPGQKEGA